MNARTQNIGNIINGLHKINESDETWKTIAGVKARVDKDGNVIDEKAKKLIEKRLGKPIDEEESEEESGDE